MAIAFVQAWGGTQLNFNTGGDTGTLTTTTGNFVAAVYSSSDAAATFDQSHTPFTMTDSGLGGLSNTGDTVWTQYYPNITGGSGHSIGINTAAAQFSGITAAEYSGIVTSTPVDRTASGTGNSASLVSSATATTTQNDILLIGGGTINTGANSTFSAGGSYTVRSQVGNGGAGTVVFLEDQIVSATGTYTAAATWNGGSGAYICTVVAFKGVSTGGATATPAAIAVTVSIPAATVTGQASATATPSAIAAAVTMPAATATSGTGKASFNFDFNVEAKLFDDLAVNWDDPDFPAAGNATAAPAAIAATTAINAATLTATGSITPAPIAAAVTMPAASATAGGANVTDDFNRANGAIGSNWSIPTGSTSPQIVSNQLVASASTEYAARWSANNFANDQFAQVVATVSGVFGGINLEVRTTDSASQPFYGLFYSADNGGQLRLYYYNGADNNLDIETGLGSGTAHTIRLEVTGTSLTGYFDGSPVVTGTDSNLTSGRVGIYLSRFGATTATIDDFSAGPIVSGSATATPAAISAVVSLPAPTVTGGGGSGTATPATIAAVVTLPAATATSGAYFSDDFNRADGGLGSNWTTPVTAAPSIASNVVIGTGNGVGYESYWNANTPADAQFGQIAVTMGSSESWAGMFFRADTGTSFSNNAYFIAWNSNSGGTYLLGRHIAAAEVILDSATGVGTSGTKTLRFEANGSALRMLVDGVEELTATDSTHTDGVIGIFLFKNLGGSGAIIDNFAGGDLSTTVNATATPATISAVVTLPAPTVTAGGAATTTPATISVLVSMPQVTLPLAFAYPVSISGRKLLDQNSQVFLLPTMSSWGMSSQLSNADITTYLGQVAANHFKGVTIFIGGGYNIGSGWNTYTNQAGNQYWATTAGGNTSATPWACGVGSAGTQLGAAWSTFDHIVTETARLGLVLTAAFCGGFGDTGASDDWEAVTNTQMYNTGVKIATRYLGTAPHMIWELMLDNASITPASTRGTRIQNLMSGINDTEGTGARPIRWLETGGSGATTNDAGWFGTGFFNATINCIYTYSSNSVEEFENGWAETTAPTGDCEPPYVGSSYYSGDGHQKTRERNYAIFLEGGCLINFGHEDWWPFGAAGLFSEGLTPATVMASSSLQEAKYCWDFIDAYVKDSSWAPSSFVTTGTGSGATKASAGASNSRAAAYFPNSRSITVDTTAIPGGGNVRLRWFDPSNNSYTTINAGEAKNASRNVTHPGNNTNSVSQSDYVLIVDEVGDAVATPAAISVVVTMPTPVAKADVTRSVAAPVNAVVTMPTPTKTATATVPDLRVFNGASPGPFFILPTPTVTATSSITPAPIAAVVTLPTPTFSLGASIVPAPIAVAVTMPTPTLQAAASLTTAVILAPVTMPLVTATGTAAGTAAPSPIFAAVILPTPTVTATSTKSIAAPISVVVSMPTPTVKADVTTTPAPINVVVTMPTPVGSVSITRSVAAPINATVTLPTPTFSLGGSTTPPPIAAAVTMPTPTFSLGASLTTTPILAPVTMPLVNATGTAAGVTAPSPIFTAVTMPTPTVTASVTTTPATIAVTATPTPTWEIWDDFNRASIGADWGAITGLSTMAIVSNTSVRPSASVTHCGNKHVTSLALSDHIVEADFNIATSTTANSIMLLMRMPSGTTNTGYYVSVPRDSTVNREIGKIVNGTFTVLAAEADGTWTGTRRIRGQVKGNTIKLFIDGVEEMSVVDSEIATGTYVGIRGHLTPLTSWTLDNFLARSLPVQNANVIPAGGWIIADVSMPTPTKTVGGTRSPAPISVLATLPTPTLLATGLIIPAPIAAAVTMPAVTAVATSAGTTAPAPIFSAVTMPTPTFSLGASTVPAPIAAAVTMPAATVSGGAGATTAPVPIAAAVTLPSPTLQVSASTAPSPIAAVVSMPAVTATGTAGVTAAPATISAVVTVNIPSLTAGGQAAPNPVLAAVTLPTPISQPESTTSPAPITLLVTFPTPTLTTSSQAAPATILARVTMPTVSLPGAILPPQVTVDLEVLVPDVTLTTFVPNVTLTLL